LRPIPSGLFDTVVFLNIFYSFSHAHIGKKHILQVPHGLAQSKAVTGENSPLVVSADSVRSGTCPKDPSGTRQELEIMRLKTENTMNREMNNGKTKNYRLPGIHCPGKNEDCREQSMGNPLHPKVQQTEQIARSGY